MNQGEPGVVFRPEWFDNMDERLQAYLREHPKAQVIMIDSMGMLYEPGPGVQGKRADLVIVDEAVPPPAGISREWLEQVVTIRMAERIEPVVCKVDLHQGDTWRRQGKRKGYKPR